MHLDFWLTMGALAAFPLLPLVIEYFWKLRKYPGSGRIFLAAVVIQVMAMVALWIAYIAKIPSSAAMIMMGVLLVYSGIGFVIGLLLCPLCYFMAAKPDNWRRKTLRTLSAYAIVAVLTLSPFIATKLGIGANVELYGRVTSPDGSPLANAEVHFSNCPYIKTNPAITDRDGLFVVRANCESYFVVKRIHNPATRTDCLSRFSNDSHRILLSFDDLPGEPWSGGRPHWRDYAANNPFTFHCVWDQPPGLLKKSARLRMDRTDSRRTLNLHAETYDELLQGDGEIEIHYVADSATFVIRALNGQVQRVRSEYAIVNTAPTGGYTDQVEIKVSEPQHGEGARALFFNIGDTYGYLAVRFETKVDPMRLELEYLFNPDGGINLVAHDREDEPILNRSRQPGGPELQMVL